MKFQTYENYMNLVKTFEEMNEINLWSVIKWLMKWTTHRKNK